MVAVKEPSRTAVTTPNADGSAGTVNPNLSSAIKVGNRLFLSGMLGNDASNAGKVGPQTTEALARLGRTLKAAGFDWPNVVEGMVYLPDIKSFGDDERRLPRRPAERLPRPRDDPGRPHGRRRRNRNHDGGGQMTRMW